MAAEGVLMRVRALAALTVVALSASAATPTAQEAVDRDIQWKIRREATDNSHIMRTLQVLTDVYGPRLTGSPNLKGASDWIVKETTAWGLKNAHLDHGSSAAGWPAKNSRCTWSRPSRMRSSRARLTPGTNGPIRAQTCLGTAGQPTKESWRARRRAAVKGTIAGGQARVLA
jgi:hypothetical protein